MADPTPPEGHASWIDYAVSTMDTRELFLSQTASASEGQEPVIVSRGKMRQAARKELATLRAKAEACNLILLATEQRYAMEEAVFYLAIQTIARGCKDRLAAIEKEYQ